MPTYDTISQKRTDDKRPAHQVLGVDARGCVHHYHAAAETVLVVHPDAGRVQRHDPDRVAVDHWVDSVADQFGWADCRYGQTIPDLAANMLGLA